MKYRKFGKLDWKASVLGFGAMRLPVLGDENSHFNPNVDEKESIKMIRHAIDNGVNYLDTAYPYHGGRSEVVVGKALKDGYREKTRVATKMPLWQVSEYADFDRNFNEQLKRLETDYIDFYLLHGLNKALWSKANDLNILKWAEEKLDKGLIKYLGFSFHDEYKVFKEIIDAYDNWTFCQIQYNFMDVEYQAGINGLRYAADKGLAVVVMEPLRGGQLVKEPPSSVKELWESAQVKRSPVEWALQWVWNHPEVSVVLSGMSTLQHVTDNLVFAGRSGAGSLSQEDLDIIDKVRSEYKKLSRIPCTRCGYCMPCPNGVDIPGVFDIYNDAFIYGDLEPQRFRYNFIPKEHLADNCIQCLECEEKCPQGIPISDWLEKVHELLHVEPEGNKTT